MTDIFHGTTILSVRRDGVVALGGDGQVSLGDTPHGTIEYQSIFAVGAVLFVTTLMFNYLAHRLVKRFRSAYE